MDNWIIVKGANNLDAAYDFINYILDPANSAKELEYHGYNTALKGIEDEMADTKYPEIIFFTEQVETMSSQEINSAAGPPGRHLQQGQGRRRRMTTTLGTGEVERGRRRANDARSCRSSRSPCHRGCGTSASSSSRSSSSSSTASAPRSRGRPATST